MTVLVSSAPAGSLEPRPLGRLAAYWAKCEPVPSSRRVPGTIPAALFGLAVGLVFAYFAYRNGWLLLYSDAQSHLTIARRLVDGPSPGFAMLGTVWLPLPHLLLAPLVSSYWLWSTGLAGAILGVSCLSLTCAATWRIASRIGLAPAARIVTLVALVSCPGVLYLHATALTEPVLIACLTAAVAGLAGWIYADHPLSPGELAVFAGVPSAGAVLSRYEGWAFVFFAALFVLLASYRRWRSFKYSLGLALAYVGPPAAAVLWWLSYNWVRFKDPLSFARDEYSAAAQQGQLDQLGLLATKHNLGLSTWTYNWTVWDVAGPVLLCLVGVGIVVLLVRRGTSTSALLVWLMGFTYPFALLSLYLGQTAIRNEHSLPSGMFNIRLAATLLPFFAILAGLAVDAVRKPAWLRTLAAALMGVLLVGFFTWSYMAPETRIAVLKEGFANSAGQVDALAAAAFLTENYQGGRILIDDGANPVLMRLGVGLDDVVATFNEPDYANALEDPTTVKWVYVDTASQQDRVWKALSSSSAFLERFHVAFTSGHVQVWERNS